MKRKLEITRKLEFMAVSSHPKKLGNLLENSVAILNLPASFHCDKGCPGCVMQKDDAILKEREGALPRWKIFSLISEFSEKFGTKFITINGRGGPLHPMVKGETLEKIQYAEARGISSYLFTSGDYLEPETCELLAALGSNVMISLLGNGFLDKDFFSGREYQGTPKTIAGNVRMLISAFRDSRNQPEEGLTRLGMNYVVSRRDLKKPARLRELKKAANDNGIFFVCNVDFEPDLNPFRRARLLRLAKECSDFNLSHSTSVKGICQMGAGSSLTIAPDGSIYHCPYMYEGSDGNITTVSEEQLLRIAARYITQEQYACIKRKTKAQKKR
ncbi:hypothetical protein GF318_06160 [Candidatus Micrarchaeota archaeon]|nr:hypothetical protein [Candidatus Micrarchaeota archaeon]